MIDLMSLGELFRELRIARGLKLKDVARDNLSISQLSKFENGQTMLAADKLLLAISGINMTFEEFGFAVNNYENSHIHNVGKEMLILQENQDVDGLKKLLEKNSSHDVYDIYNRLNTLVIETSIKSIDPTYELSDDYKDFLTNYLYSIEEWTEYELYIFGNTLSILSSEDLIFLGKAFIERDKLYLSLSQHKNNAKMTLLNLIMRLISNKELFYVPYFISKLEELTTYQDMFIIVFLNFLKKIIKKIQEHDKEKQDLIEYVEMVEKLGNPTLALILRSNLELLN